MVSALFGLVGAFVYGAADFLGGLAARRIGAQLVTAVAAVTGLLVLLIALPVFGGEWTTSTVFWGALSGVSGAIAIFLLYACLAIGPMSILSPLTALVSAIVPLTFGLLGGDRLAPSGYWGLGLALLAVVLVGFVPESGAVRPSLKGVLMATGSGMMIGTFIILIDQTPDESGLVPLVMNRAVNGAIMFAVVGVLALRRHRRAALVLADGGGPSTDATAAVETGSAALRSGFRLAALCGIVDVTANILLLLGLRLGELSVMSVLTAMYPIGTILLAAIVLKERIAPVQWAGLVLALVAAALLAAA